MHQTKRNILLNPGPVTTTPGVKHALVVPDICHREKAFTRLLQSIRHDLVTIAHGDADHTAILFSASGTGAVEACITSVIPNHKKLLVINNGAYGRRICQIAKRFAIEVIEYTATFDQEIDVSALEQRLQNDDDIAAVAVVHHETSSGILNALSPLGEICHRHQRLFIVDAMSSFGGIDIDVQREHIDFLISSSNKCLHGMPGLSFVVANLTALKATEGNARGFYFDLHQQYHALEESGQMAFTPPVQIAYAFRRALDEFLLETLPVRRSRFEARYQQLKQGLERLGFECVTPSDRASQLLMIVRYPGDHFDFDAFHDYLFTRGFTIYPQKLPIKNTFRLACLGDLTERDIIKFLDLVATYLRSRMAVSKDGEDYA